MSVLTTLADFITVPPGDLVYHVVTLFAIQLISALAIGHWARHRTDRHAQRLVALAATLVTSKIALFLVSLLHQAGTVSASSVLPPLERLLELCVVVVVAWATLPVLSRQPRLGAGLLVTLLVLGLTGYALSATRWSRIATQTAAYNAQWQHSAWESATLVILGTALLGALLDHGRDWSLVASLFGLLFVAHGLQLTRPDAAAHTAGWVRVGNLAALPLLAGIAYRAALRGSQPRGKEPIPAISTLLRVIGRIESAQDPESALALSAGQIAFVLGADVAALGVPVDDRARELRVISVHPEQGSATTPGSQVISASQLPLLASVLQTRRGQYAHAPSDDTSVASFYALLGFEQPGTLLLEPLLLDNELLGMLFLGNPVTKHQWTMGDLERAKTVSAALAGAISRAREREEVPSADELTRSRREVQRLSALVAQLQGKLEEERQTVEELATRDRLRERTTEDMHQEDEERVAWRDEARRLAAAQASLQRELAEWKSRADSLGRVYQRLHETTEGAPHPASVSDTKSPLTDAPDSTGAADDDLFGRPVEELFTEPLWAQTVQELSEPHVQPGETRTVTLSLGDKLVRARLTKLPDAPGENPVLAVMLQPEDDSAQRSEIVIPLIQQLRSPMTSIAGYTDMLLAESIGILGKTQRQFLEKVKGNLDRMKDLLDDLVGAVTARDTVSAASPQEVDVADTIASGIASLSRQLSDRNVTVRMDMPAELIVSGTDPDNLHEIVRHLVSHACSRSEPGSELLVHADLQRRQEGPEEAGDYLYVSTTEMSGSLTPTDQQRVFEWPYETTGGPLSTSGPDIAGLAVARILIEAQGGRMWLQNEEDAGTTYSFLLPVPAGAPDLTTPPGDESSAESHE
jgi:signal transduction histidine kinase